MERDIVPFWWQGARRRSVVGFVRGANNAVVIVGLGNATTWAPDFVGLEIFE